MADKPVTREEKYLAYLTGDYTGEIPKPITRKEKYLLNMKLPHNLKSIGQRVFSNCGRLCGTLELPASVTAIEFGAFMGCDNLRYVLATGNKITTLGDNLFGEGVPSKLVYKK